VTLAKKLPGFCYCGIRVSIEKNATKPMEREGSDFFSNRTAFAARSCPCSGSSSISKTMMGYYICLSAGSRRRDYVVFSMALRLDQVSKHIDVVIHVANRRLPMLANGPYSNVCFPGIILT
jgi:hypothetical protein